MTKAKSHEASPLPDPRLTELRHDETRSLITFHFCSRDDLCYSRLIAGNLMTVFDGIRAQEVKKFFLWVNFTLTQALPIATFFDKVHESIPEKFSNELEQLFTYEISWQ